MKTKLFALFLALMASANILYAESGACGENLKWDLTGGVLTISGTGDMYDFEYKYENGLGYCNTPWHSQRENITSVVINDGVTNIGYGAFYGCSAIYSATIANSVTGIGSLAFCDCSSLTFIEIPNTVEIIGVSVFSGCTDLPVIDNLRYADTYLVGAVDKSLLTYTIKEGTKWIGYQAFSWCDNLTSLTIPNSVTCIGQDAFSSCTGLTSIEIPNSVTRIEGNAFFGCTSLTSITIPNSVFSIGASVFMWSGITSPVYNVHAFAYLPPSYSGHYSIPEGVGSISGGAFIGCKNLTSLSIPNTVTSIGVFAFESCHGLTSVTIPKSVTNIGTWAFDDCTGLTSVSCLAITLPKMGVGVFADVDCSQIPLYVPKQSLELYQAADQWKDFGMILPVGEDINQVSSEETQLEKIMRNGQILIINGEKTFTLTGQEVK